MYLGLENGTVSGKIPAGSFQSRGGLGQFDWGPVISAVGQVGASAASAAISKPGGKPLSEYELAQQALEAWKRQRQFILLAGGGLALVFVLIMAMR